MLNIQGETVSSYEGSGFQSLVQCTEAQSHEIPCWLVFPREEGWGTEGEGNAQDPALYAHFIYRV